MCGLTVNKAALLTQKFCPPRKPIRGIPRRGGLSQPALRLIALGKRTRLTHEAHDALLRLTEHMCDGPVARLKPRGVAKAQEELAAIEWDIGLVRAELRAFGSRAPKHLAPRLAQLEASAERLKGTAAAARGASREDHRGALAMVRAVGALQRELRENVEWPKRTAIIAALARREARSKVSDAWVTARRHR